LPTLVTLTPREREVVQLVAEGLSNKQIGKRLSLSIKTVECHRGAAMRKAGTRQRIWSAMRCATTWFRHSRKKGKDPVAHRQILASSNPTGEGRYHREKQAHLYASCGTPARQAHSPFRQKPCHWLSSSPIGPLSNRPGLPRRAAGDGIASSVTVKGQ